MSTCILCRHVLCFKLYIIIKCFDAGGLKLLLCCRGVFQRHCHDDIILFESDNASLTDAILSHMGTFTCANRFFLLAIDHMYST